MRYIDADKLIKTLFPIGLIDDGKYTINAKAVKYAVDNTPTADVVPKGECAKCAEKTRNTIVKLQGQINRLKKYDEERDIALHARLIAETREKVAMEFFEEIESGQVCGAVKDTLTIKYLPNSKRNTRRAIMILDIPCKIGDTVWAVRNYHSAKKIVPGKVSEMYFIGKEMTLCIVVKNVCHGRWGKNVFGSYEEAEKRLIECQTKR